MTPRAEGGRRILLVGMMGSGKTTVGRLLAERLGWPYHDNDDLLRSRFGVTAREALVAGGESGLRTLESEALEAALERPPPSIVGVPAGTILDETDRRRLREARATVVWLRATAETLAERSEGSSHRAWLDEDAAAWSAAALVEREPLYLGVADVTVEVDELEPDEVADAILERLNLP